MIKREVPAVGASTREIFKLCAQNFRDNAKKSRILKYELEVEKSEAEYPLYIPSDVEHFPEHYVDPNDAEDIISLYDLKLAKASFKEGRMYYDAIRVSSGGTCAICNVGVASTLDHYLPKSRFPLLCVSPENLVPECADCNKNKSDFFMKEYSNMLLHPYFDDLSGIRWLEVKLTFSNTIIIPQYYNGYNKDDRLAKRISLTLEKYKLDILFAVQANSEITNNSYEWKRLLDEANKDALQNMIKRNKMSYEMNDINSWKSALYRAIEQQFDDFVDWLMR